MTRATSSDLAIEPLDALRPGLPGLRLLLDAPGRRNALTLETVLHLQRVLSDEPTEILLLGSSSPGIFSAGADITTDNATRARLSNELYGCYELMVTRRGPVIAVVEGPAVGGGAQLSTAADLRVASSSARWRWVGPGHGLAVGAWILPELVGRSRALDLTLTGRWLDSDDALTSGLLTRLTQNPWQTALDIAEDLYQADPAAVARVKQVATKPTLVELLRQERDLNAASWDGRAPAGQRVPKPEDREG